MAREAGRSSSSGAQGWGEGLRRLDRSDDAGAGSGHGRDLASLAVRDGAGSSSYTYAEATRDQRLGARIGSHIHAFEYFGGRNDSLRRHHPKRPCSPMCLLAVTGRGKPLTRKNCRSSRASTDKAPDFNPFDAYR
jgi:hypothetical protein